MCNCSNSIQTEGFQIYPSKKREFVYLGAPPVRGQYISFMS